MRCQLRDRTEYQSLSNVFSPCDFFKDRTANVVLVGESLLQLFNSFKSFSSKLLRLRLERERAFVHRDDVASANPLSEVLLFLEVIFLLDEIIRVFERSRALAHLKAPRIEVVRVRREYHEMDIEFPSRSDHLLLLEEFKRPGTDCVLGGGAHDEVIVEDGKSPTFQVGGQTVLMTWERCEEVKGSVHGNIVEVVLETIVSTEGLNEVYLLEVGFLIDDENDVLVWYRRVEEPSADLIWEHMDAGVGLHFCISRVCEIDLDQELSLEQVAHILGDLDSRVNYKS